MAGMPNSLPMLKALAVLIVAVFGWLAAAAPAAAADAVIPQAPWQRHSAADEALLNRVETYLNELRTLKSRFLQVASSGGSAEGTLYLSRPGRMRLEYDPPSPILVVADGRFLIYYDSQLQQVSYLSLDSTPAGILLRPEIRLAGDVRVTAIKHTPGAVEIGMVQAGDPGAGELTLLFTEAPFALRQWRVKDAQGQVVTVSLFGTVEDARLDPKLFQFQDPTFFKQPSN